jgi:hypothetical protein
MGEDPYRKIKVWAKAHLFLNKWKASQQTSRSAREEIGPTRVDEEMQSLFAALFG